MAKKSVVTRELSDIRFQGRSVALRLENLLAEAKQELSFHERGREILGPREPLIEDEEALLKILRSRILTIEFLYNSARTRLSKLDERARKNLFRPGTRKPR